MGETKRSIFARSATFIAFLWQQQRNSHVRASGLRGPDPLAPVALDGSEKAWTRSGQTFAMGERFQVIATGYQWLAKPLGLVVEPLSTVYMRLGEGPIRKLIGNDAIYEAWSTGELSFLTKGLSEFADDRGELLPGKRLKQGPGIGLRVIASPKAASGTGQPDGWNYLWRIGDGRIYQGDPDDITVSTTGDVGILQRQVDVVLTDDTQLNWDWLIEELPSALPEDIAFTHDYLSIAVEFDNGRDLTYMWSAGLPNGHVFRCPLGWWCERETHWVLRSGSDGLGHWHEERRSIAADYAKALGGPMPQKVVRVWLIANSVFQRRLGKARFRNIIVS
jgi:hypothetical protein